MFRQVTILLLLVLFLICPVFTRAARPSPKLLISTGQESLISRSSTSRTTAAAGGGEDDGLCKGVVGDEECRMMRRELAAHLDYIYTQNKRT